MIDERELKEQLLENTHKDFLSWVKSYDESFVPIMKQRGYTCIHSVERTVAFTFGEFTFRRRRWKKGNSWVVPVDEKLGLEKNARYSREFMYQIARLATLMPYSKVVHVIELTYHIVITKPTVVKAVKLCADLLEEQKEYQTYQEDSDLKEVAEAIYIEGDGVMVRSSEKSIENKHIDLSHFVVHTGTKKVGNRRFKLQDKKEFVSLSNRLVREQVLDYLYHHFEITADTLLITNSDGGHGYTPYVFKEMAKALQVGRHEHFWDEYHLNQKLKTFFKSYPAEFLDKAFQAIQRHDKNLLRTVLDTTESLIETEEELESFHKFKRKLLQNFQYTKPAELRGFSHSGIGIMESQHRKITYRMKRGGKYWTVRGAEAMSQMILLEDKGQLRDLLLGSWREEYQKIHSQGLSGGEIRRLEPQKSSQVMPTGKITWKKFKP